MNLGIGGLTAAERPATEKDELDNRFLSIQHGWLVEHQLDGTHKPTVSRTITPSEFFADTAAGDLVVFGNSPSQTYLYRVRGLSMYIQLVLRDCTVTNTPTYFKVLIPDEWYASHDGITVGYVDNNGTLTPAKVEVTAGSRHIKISKIVAGTWANATKNTDIAFTWEFNVRR